MISTASSARLIPFQENRLLQGLAGLYAVIWVVAAIDPLFPFDWFLENMLVVIYVGVLAATYRKYPFSDLSYLLMAVFLSFHAVGAHYTYSHTPMGFWMQDWFGWERNHYDRVLHFMFGLVMTYPIREMLMRWSGLAGRWLVIGSFAGAMFFSTIYETIEWFAALLVSTKAANAYLGAQGDFFDAQKDEGLTFIGSLICLGLVYFFSARRRSNE